MMNISAGLLLHLTKLLNDNVKKSRLSYAGFEFCDSQTGQRNVFESLILIFIQESRLGLCNFLCHPVFYHIFKTSETCKKSLIALKY